MCMVRPFDHICHFFVQERSITGLIIMQIMPFLSRIPGGLLFRPLASVISGFSCRILWLRKSSMLIYLGDNCIQIFHLVRYIVGYTVGNLVLRRRASGAVNRDFRTYIRRYTSPNEKFEYGYPHSNALLQFRLK